MAVASDRVPCPQCGEFIHPIAGRCKHCKADLATIRGVRPAAAASLPSLATGPVAISTPVIVRPPVASNGAVVSPLAYEDSQPVLPPRTTARQLAAVPERAWWKSWPILVIVLAGIAIIVAIVLLVWPPHDKQEAGTSPPPPAPDRMDTNPMVPGANGSTPSDPKTKDPKDPSAKDPWQGKVDPPPVDPARPLPPDPIPPAPADPDDDDTLGLGGVLGGGGTGTPGAIGGMGSMKSVGMLSAMLQHGCARLSSCGADSMLKQTCDQLTAVLGKSPMSPPSCAAAQRCLEQIDALDCGVKMDDFAKIMSMQSKVAACVDAMQCT